jgi:hypothetical protein
MRVARINDYPNGQHSKRKFWPLARMAQQHFVLDTILVERHTTFIAKFSVKMAQRIWGAFMQRTPIVMDFRAGICRRKLCCGSL